MANPPEDQQNHQPMLQAASSLPQSVHHSLTLSDGRTLSYYTFKTDAKGQDSEEAASSSIPVLYLHGFPGCGLEGAVCAEQVAAQGGVVYAPDRAGFGHSDPAVNDDDSNKTLVHDKQTEDLWEMMRLLQWERFSVIAVSGGGPFALALLASYLESPSSKPQWKALSLVAGVWLPAGKEGMMKTNQDIYDLVQAKSTWKLRIGFEMSRVFLSILPTSWLLRFVPIKDLPPIDQEAFANPLVGNFMINVLATALRQGGKAATLEAAATFSQDMTCAETLRRQFASIGANSIGASSDGVPKIGIFQGGVDKNVPKSHAHYMHQTIMNSVPQLFEYQDLGHLSLVIYKAREYSEFVLTPRPT